MENIFRRSSGWKWVPDADPVNAPEGSLLQADNTIPDRLGARSLRLGSTPIYEGLQEQRVHSLYTAILQAEQWRLAGIDDQVYRNGASFGSAFESFGIPFAGSEDISFADDSYQAFMARATTKKKFDGSNFNNWGIAAPEFAVSLAAVNALTTSVATFDSAESPTFAANEGTKTFVNDYAGTANAAMSLVPSASTGRGSVSKIYSSDQDYLNVAGSQGGPTDLFDMRVWLQDPRKVDKVTIMFGLGTGADPFVDDYFYFNFNIRNDGTADVKDSAAAAAAAYQTSTSKLLASLSPQEITNIRTPEAAGEIMKRLGGQFVGPQTRERPDAQQNSPAWGHFSVTRGQFIRVGHTPDRDWSTIRGFKIIYTAVPGSTEAIYMDDAIYTGGGDRALTGTFQVGYRFARRLLDNNGNEVYTELSPMSPISDKIVLRQQTMQITIPATSLTGADPQVDTVWVYLYGGWLDTFYRFVVLSSELNPGMTIDELTNPSGSDFEDPEERVRLTTHGFSRVEGEGSGTNDLIFTIRKSETDALVDNEPFEPGAVGPPDNVIGIAGPQGKRLFLLTEEGWVYPSTIKSPSCFSLYQTIDLRMYGTPYWIIKTSSGVYAGCSKDIIRISGSGDESDNHLIADLFAQPMSVANPPVDKMVWIDENVVFYRSADGLMSFNGQSSNAIPMAGTSLLWKGENRHETQALNRSTGRFRMATDDHNIIMLAPEGTDEDPSSVWKYQTSPEPQWSRQTYPVTYLSVYREPSGILIAGTDDGAVHELETGTQDDGVDIPITLLTPISEGSNPLAQKDAVDFQFHGYTGGKTATVAFYRNGDPLTAVEKEVSLVRFGVHRNQLVDDLDEFLKIQLRITGSFSTFSFAAVNMQVITRPQHVVALDLGALIPQDGADLAWATQVEADIDSQADLELDIYKNDRLWQTLSVPVTVGDRDVYTIPMPRGTKARRLGFVLRTTAADGSGEIGFECYSFKVRDATTGNQTELVIGQGDSGSA